MTPARFYAAILRLYPVGYRRAFGAQMMQTFMDWHADLCGESGHVGLGAWLALLLDEGRNIAGERMDTLRNSRPRPATLFKLAMPAFILLVTAKAPRAVDAHRASTPTAEAPDPVMRLGRISIHPPLRALGNILSYAAPATAYAQAPLRPLPAEALVNLNTLSSWGIGSLSPDGRWLVYTVREGKRLRDTTPDAGASRLPSGLSADRTAGTNLYLVDTRTGHQERITDDVGRYEEPTWSPDGSRIAFYSDRDGVGRTWVWELATRRLRRLAPDRVHPSEFASLRWTPDSKAVIALLESARVVSSKHLAPQAPATILDSTASPGATVRVYRSEVRRDTVIRSEAGIDTVTMDTVSIWGAMSADLATIGVADGVVRRLARARPIFWYEPSPDGRFIAFSHQSAIIMAAGQPMYDYELVPISGGASRTIVRRGRSGTGTASWSPDSRTLAYVALGPLANGDIHLVDVAEGRDRTLTTAPHPRLLSEGATPTWSPDGRALFLAMDGRIWKATVDGVTLTALKAESWNRRAIAILTDASGGRVHSTDGGRTFTVATYDRATRNVGFHRIDVMTGAATALREERRSLGSGRFPPIVSRDGSTIAYLVEDGQHPPDIWGGSADLTSPRQFTTLNPAISHASLGRTRVIDYTGAKGQKLQGVLLYPGEYQEGKRYPLIVRVYPGPYPWAASVDQFGLDGADGIRNMQMFASRGYAVLFPEVPQDLGTPVHDLVAGVDSAVNRVVAMGVADPGRLGVTGQSYGAYATIALVTRTQRFQAAVMSDGIGNLIDAALQFRPESGTDVSFWTEGGQGLMGGPIWEQKDRYIENSPILSLDQVHTPLLIVHGEDDDAFPVALGDQIFVGLRRLGREAEYRRYAGEGHQISGAANVMDYWAATMRWFDVHLKGAG